MWPKLAPRGHPLLLLPGLLQVPQGKEEVARFSKYKYRAHSRFELRVNEERIF